MYVYVCRYEFILAAQAENSAEHSLRRTANNYPVHRVALAWTICCILNGCQNLRVHSSTVTVSSFNETSPTRELRNRLLHDAFIFCHSHSSIAAMLTTTR